MSKAPTSRFSCFLLLLGACGGTAADGGGSTRDPGSDVAASDPTSHDGSAVDAAPPTDAGSDGAPGDASPCVTSDAGALQPNYYCDLAIIHVMRHTGGTPTVIVQARVGTGSDACGVVDGVDVLRGSTTLAHLGSSNNVALGSQYADIATGDGSALVGECSNETTRLSAYGLVIRGRDTKGPFEARCGTAESGSRWPPGTSLACHQNLARPPVGPGGFDVMNNAAGSSTMIPITLPHAAGQPAATTIDGTVRIVSPQHEPFGSGAPLTSKDTTGWTGYASEGSTGFGDATQISLNQFGATPALDTTLCPLPSTPGPGSPMPPWFIARVTGQGPSGPVQAEVLTSCTTVTGP